MIGQSLHRELDTRKIAKLATDAATTAIDAEFGSCFYTLTSANGQAQTRFALAGTVPAERFENLPMPRPTSLVGAAFPGTAPIRSGDVTADPRYGQRAPFHGLPPGHPPVRSFLALPITTIGGTVLGSMYFGHSEPNRFTERDEQIVKGIAGQAASAMDNARLYRLERETAVELQNSLLPAYPPQLAELEIAFTYLPGAQGTQVGGDWFDVIPLSGGRVALVIGDVMGRGIRAAAIMGQLRTAVRAYAVMDLPPGQIMHLLNRLVCTMPASAASSSAALNALSASGMHPAGDRRAGTGRRRRGRADRDLRLRDLRPGRGGPDLGQRRPHAAGADHPGGHGAPAGGRPRDAAGHRGGGVRREGPAAGRRQQAAAVHRRPGGVPQRAADRAAEPAVDGAGALRGRAGRSRNSLSAPLGTETVQRTCDRLLHAMLSGDEHDDVALLMVRTRPTRIRKAALDLDPDPMAARAARRFVTSTLQDWDLDHLTDDVLSVVTELVTNATQHAATTSQLALRSHPGRLMVEVADCDGRIPRPAVTQHMDERHRGLLIVAQLSQRWGVRPTDRGKIVWAEMAEADRRTRRGVYAVPRPSPAWPSKPSEVPMPRMASRPRLAKPSACLKQRPQRLAHPPLDHGERQVRILPGERRPLPVHERAPRSLPAAGDPELAQRGARAVRRRQPAGRGAVQDVARRCRQRHGSAAAPAAARGAANSRRGTVAVACQPSTSAAEIPSPGSRSTPRYAAATGSSTRPWISTSARPGAEDADR